MSDDPIELSRRKILAGLGTIGVASAGVGMGTSAYFSDVETYEDNVLTAGALDLTVDWEEHYSDWSDDEAAGPDGGTLDIQMSDPDDPDTPDVDEGADYVGLPDPTDPLIWVHEEDLGAFMDNTSIEAYPDADDNGVQDEILYGDTTEADELEYLPCEEFAQVDEDLDPDGGTELRSLNMDTVANWPLEEGEDAEPAPLVNLQDVKPGDFGELTLSFHLCDNPGYVWLTGDLVEASENGLTEPEMKDPDEDQTLNETGDIVPKDGVDDPEVELLDEIQTLLWYDEDGDNVYEPGGEAGKADIMLVLDRSGSMSGTAISDAKTAANKLIDSVGDDAQIGVVGFADEATMAQQLTDVGNNAQAVKDAVNNLSAGGGTNVEEAIDLAHNEVDGHDVYYDYTASGKARSGAEKIVVLLTDGSPNEGYDDIANEPSDDGTADTPFESEFGGADPADNADFLKEGVHDVAMYTVGFGGISSGSDEANLLSYMATDDGGVFIGGQDELFDIFSQIAKQIEGEECFFRGSLRELINELGMGSDGIPLDGNRTSEFDEVPGFGNDAELEDGTAVPSDPTAEARDCFVPSTTNALGLAWWLPVDHANEIQTDSVSFDLGFYTEQCRHNEGG
ncbi:MAG: putative ribosomally synthesized peptide with SipW-like signal peptide, partial [Halobacteriales archaeon]